jgi:glutamate formiminotransferase/formiminotetrahydrofolate cyclodeaminase
LCAPGWRPDAGPAAPHPTAGATVVGARRPLIAFNAVLANGDLRVADAIARRIRASAGGLPAVQALGISLASRGLAQVSMNLLDIDVTPPATVFAAVQAEARARGVDVLKSEVVGLIPERAITGAGAAYLKLPDAHQHLLEAKIRAADGPPLAAWLDDLASGAPVPGGGSAAALAGALGGALVAMVARLTIGRRAYASAQTRAAEILEEADALRSILRDLVYEDAAAYARVSDAYRLPKDAPGRGRAIDEALLGAARTPLAVARAAARAALLAAEIERIGNTNARTDARVARALAATALSGALENVRVNIEALSDPAMGREMLEEAQTLQSQAKA